MNIINYGGNLLPFFWSKTSSIPLDEDEYKPLIWGSEGPFWPPKAKKLKIAKPFSTCLKQKVEKVEGVKIDPHNSYWFSQTGQGLANFLEIVGNYLLDFGLNLRASKRPWQTFCHLYLCIWHFCCFCIFHSVFYLFSCPGQLNNWHCLSLGAN